MLTRNSGMDKLFSDTVFHRATTVEFGCPALTPGNIRPTVALYLILEKYRAKDVSTLVVQ